MLASVSQLELVNEPPGSDNTDPLPSEPWHDTSYSLPMLKVTFLDHALVHYLYKSHSLGTHHHVLNSVDGFVGGSTFLAT